MQTAYLYLQDEFKTPESIDYANLQAKRLTSSQLKRHEGIYWNSKGGYSRTIAVKKDTLRYVRGEGNESSLIPLSKDKFQMISFGDEEIIVSFAENGKEIVMSFVIGESAPVTATKVKSFTYTTADLASFTGIYYCKPLNTVYEFSIEDGNLIAKTYA